MFVLFSSSSLVQRVLEEAKSSGRSFRVVVVGARPWQEAEQMLMALTRLGVRCSYALISAISGIMKEVRALFNVVFVFIIIFTAKN